MQRYTISNNNLFDESMTLFSLSQIYSKPKIGVTPLIEINSTDLQDGFEDNNDFSKFISVFNLDGENTFPISANDLLDLSDLYFSKDKDNRNIDDIKNLNLHRFDDLKTKIDKEELIIFSVSAFYQETKVDERHNNAKYKEYQSYYSELEDKENFTMTDPFYFDNTEYLPGTFFIFADYNQTDFITIQPTPGKCLVKLPIKDENAVKIGQTAIINVKSSLDIDKNVISDSYQEEIRILAKTKEIYTVPGNSGDDVSYTHNWAIFLMDCTRAVKVDSFGIIYCQNPDYKFPFPATGAAPALIPYLYLYVNPSYHKFYPSYTALGLDYASKLFPLYYNHTVADEDGVVTNELIDIFTLLGEDTKWDYINDHTIRLPLSDFGSILDKTNCDLPISRIIGDLLSETNVLECKKMNELITERQQKENGIFNSSGENASLFQITDVFNLTYGKQPSFFNYAVSFTKDIIDKEGVPLSFRGFATEDNPILKDIRYEALFKMTIYEPPVKIMLPISQTFDIDTYQDEIVKENYLSSLTGTQINPIIDMERDCYMPVWKNGDNFTPIKTIKYYFHFKKRDSNFQLEPEQTWEDNRSPHQSDLLGEIGFSNKDIYYQKNALKKTFMRSTYYNSPSSAEQDILCYNTTFIDYRKLYQLLVNNPYLSVNRSYENERLDATITVTDKYSSKNSSEGFYIYVWKNNERIELYNSIEFNNAKFGITSPMMLVKTETDPQFPSSFKEFNSSRYIKWIAEYNESLGKHIYYIDPSWRTDNWNSSNISFTSDSTLEISLWEITLAQ